MTGTTFNATKLNFKQAFEILEILEREGTLSKENLYESIGGSRQTKIRVVKEMIDQGLIYVSSVEAHNKQFLKNTDYGRQFLAIATPGHYSLALAESGRKDTVHKAAPVTYSRSENPAFQKIKKDLNSVISLLDENPPNYDLIYLVLNRTMSELDEITSRTESTETEQVTSVAP